MPSGYYLAKRETIQNYLNENPMWRWFIVETDDPALELILSHFATEEDKNKWESWPGVEAIPRPRLNAGEQRLAAPHHAKLKSKYGVSSQDDIWTLSAKLQAKVGKMMRLPDV